MSRPNEGTGEVLLYKGIEGHICEVSKTSILKICCELIFILFVYINTIFCVFCVFSITIYSVICVYTMCNIQNNFEYNVYICSVSLVCACVLCALSLRKHKTLFGEKFSCVLCVCHNELRSGPPLNGATFRSDPRLPSYNREPIWCACVFDQTPKHLTMVPVPDQTLKVYI